MKAWRVALAMLLAVTIVPAVLGVAFAADGITLQIQDAPLKQVILLLTQQSGANIVIADQSKLDEKVTAQLTNVPLDKAMDYIVSSAGVTYKKMPDGTYIIGGTPSDDDSASTDNSSQIENSLPPVQAPPPAAPPQRIVTTVIKLVNSKPSELLRLMGWRGVNPVANSDFNLSGLNDTGYPHNTGAANSAQLNILGPSGNMYDASRAASNNNAANHYNGYNPPVAPTIDPTAMPGAGRTADLNTGAAQYVSAYGNPYQRTYAPGRTNVVPNNNQNNSNSNFLWPDGLVGQPVPFDLDNSIIVKGTEDAIAQFKAMVRMLDVPPKQVQIKAEFVQVTTKDIKNFGIDWSLQRLNDSFQTQFGPAGNVLFGFSAGNLTASLAAQLTKNVGRVVNAPIISTLNNQMAQIEITSEIPFFTSTTVVTDNVPVTSTVVNSVNVQTGLDVLPRVNGDGTITMTLMPEVSDAGTFIQGPTGYEAPETNSQYLTTTRRVADGQTIVIGGFIRKNDENDTNKIPILGDLPIVGGLFRTVAKSEDDQELLIFVTPTIIHDTGSGALGVGMNQ